MKIALLHAFLYLLLVLSSPQAARFAATVCRECGQERGCHSSIRSSVSFLMLTSALKLIFERYDVILHCVRRQSPCKSVPECKHASFGGRSGRGVSAVCYNACAQSVCSLEAASPVLARIPRFLALPSFRMRTERASNLLGAIKPKVSISRKHRPMYRLKVGVSVC